MPRFLLRPPWIFLNLLVALIVAVCAGLGRWQLQRLEERRAENAKIAALSSLPPEELTDVVPSPAPSAEEAAASAYRTVTVTGSYRPDEEIVVLTRSNSDGSRTGNHVLTPLVTSAGHIILVNRGWVPLTMNEPPIAEAAPPEGRVRVTGILLPSEEEGPARVSGGKDVRAASKIDVPALSRQLPGPTYPLYLRLQSQDPPAPRDLPQPVPLPKATEGPHVSYAIQWFTFGVIALITYGALIRRELRGSERTRA
ncbi:MAG: SURF1 family protein [Actinomycetota bacterium]|nr:SURF1 family protein [Actinomycetota bacterium]